MQAVMEPLAEKISSSKSESEPTFLAKCLNSFAFYFFYAFSIATQRVEGKYLTPLFHKETCDRLQFNERTSTVAPRFHIKSTVFEAHVSWKCLRMEHFFNEGMYVSYTSDLSAYHTKRIKRYIDSLPELFGRYKNLTDSESVLHYRGPDGRIFCCEPTGLLTFQRGKHPHNLWCDDILKDPTSRLDITQLEKINTIFFEEIEQMPKEGLHLIGTPQDQEDLFAKLEANTGYNCRRYDAIVDENKKLTLWPQRFPWDKLQETRARIGDKAFNKEFRCMPVRGEEGFLKREALDRIIRPRLPNLDAHRKHTFNEYTYGGFDIGKKSHPSHLAVFGVNRKGKLVQIHSKWMDGWDYVDQLDYCKEAIDNFHMARLEYDDTRAEFEGFKERGELPAEMQGLPFTAKNKFSMATSLDRLVTQDDIMLLNDPRQRRQLLNVDNDLKAVASSEGHGDCFFSICLAIKAALKGSRQMIYELN
jgi:hypothetical protein